jgi:hypothetical protein
MLCAMQPPQVACDGLEGRLAMDNGNAAKIRVWVVSGEPAEPPTTRPGIFSPRATRGV